MKTIRELVGDFSPIEWLKMVAALEAREKERDEDERKRVQTALAGHITLDKMQELYPPPKPEPVKLKAGWYWGREKGKSWDGCYEFFTDFIPDDIMEYRPASDPPPEVTGKAALLPDASRPSYWRGNDDGVRGACEKITAILDGKDDGSGVCGEPLEALRRRLLALVGKLKDGGE